jgi:hypothetical protein
MSFHDLLYVAAAMLCVFGAVLLAGSVVAWLRAGRRASWPVTPGRVVSSEAVLRQSGGVNARGRRKTNESWTAVVKYEYEAGGKKLAGRRVRIQAEAMGRRAAEAVAARYAPGASVEVRYDPARPEIAVLDPSAPGVGRSIGIGLLMLLAGLFLLLRGEAVLAWFSQDGA